MSSPVLELWLRHCIPDCFPSSPVIAMCCEFRATDCSRKVFIVIVMLLLLISCLFTVYI